MSRSGRSRRVLYSLLYFGPDGDGEGAEMTSSGLKSAAVQKKGARTAWQPAILLLYSHALF